jgi:hypothetical protein
VSSSQVYPGVEVENCKPDHADYSHKYEKGVTEVSPPLHVGPEVFFRKTIMYKCKHQAGENQ